MELARLLLSSHAPARPKQRCLVAAGLCAVRHASFRPNPWQRRSKRPIQRHNPSNTPSSRGQPGKSSAGSQTSGQSDATSNSSGTNPQYNTLLAPVHIPEDPDGLLKQTHPASQILANSGLVVQRQLEMMNVLLLVTLYHFLEKRGRWTTWSSG